MKTNTTSESLAEKISNGLKKVQLEIEEFALQFALGKAEATEKFEELKKEFSGKTNEWKRMFSKLESVSKEKATKLKIKFEELQLQLALGKADAKDIFEAQKKKILHSLNEIESELKKNPDLKNSMNEFKDEIEKFKLKLEILKLQFELKQFKVKENFKDAMADAGIKIDKLFRKAEDKWDDVKKKSSDFTDEIELSYKHFKKAVKSL